MSLTHINVGTEYSISITIYYYYLVLLKTHSATKHKTFQLRNMILIIKLSKCRILYYISLFSSNI
jgi:hypothetical protein